MCCECPACHPSKRQVGRGCPRTCVDRVEDNGHHADHGDEDWYTNPSDGVSFGASLDVSRFVGMNMSVDYSMLPMGDFGTNSVLALRIAF